MIKFNNKELGKLITEIKKIKNSLKKGNLGGFSIEVEEEIEEDSVSFSSFIYYDDLEKRDSDYKILLEFLNK
jgi:predicted S18 family serine protease